MRHASDDGSQQLLLLGVDGMDWEPIRRLLGAGRLPTVARLVRDGAAGNLRSLEDLCSPRIWTSIATGKLPGKHGILDFYSTQGDVKAQRIWDIAQSAGMTTGVFRWMVTWPPEPGPVFAIPDDLMARDEQTIPADLSFVSALTLGPRSSSHASLGSLAAIAARALRHGVGFGTIARGARLHLRSRLCRMADTEYVAAAGSWKIAFEVDVGVWLLERYAPEFVAGSIRATDLIQHRCWGAQRGPSSAGADQASDWGPLVEAAYILTDESLSRLLAALAPNSTVAIVSDHGFTAGDRWSHELDMSRILETAQLRGRYTQTTVAERCYVRARAASPADEPRMLAYAAARLRGLSLLPEGVPLLSVRVSEGELVVTWPGELWSAEEMSRHSVRSSASGVTVPLAKLVALGRSKWTGVHAPNGVIILHGPAVRRGATIEASVLDVAPTLLHILGLPVGEDMDGKVLTEALRPEWLAEHPIQTVPSYEREAEPDREAYSEADEQVIEERLRDLGYL